MELPELLPVAGGQPVSIFADLTPSTGVERRVDLGDDKTLLFMDDGRVLFRHRCLTGRAGDPERHRIINAAALRIGRWPHTIVSADPITITPSILCECDIHGYVTDSRWVDC